MIRAAKRPDSERSGSVIYSESFADDRQAYINGSAAPDDFWSELSQEEIHRSSRDIRMAARKSRRLAAQMNLRFVMFMGVLIAVMTLSLIGYIKLKSDISATNKEISSLESDLTELRATNNEIYNELIGNIDLEQVRQIAIEEFGMHYADQDQIVVYSESKGDSVHQIADLE
ncbi:MAG: hypothetical protein IJ110_09050 [Lachnospiraceae bacterium]|jgi:cell division protein FtsL|nr:hypothetical protein [Lachnospiraceae bacterium]